MNDLHDLAGKFADTRMRNDSLYSGESSEGHRELVQFAPASGGQNKENTAASVLLRMTRLAPPGKKVGEINGESPRQPKLKGAHFPAELQALW